MCDMTHWYLWHDSLMSVSWLIDTCDMTHSYMWHDSFIYVTWLIHKCVMTRVMCVTSLMHTCDMTHLHLRHDWLTLVTAVTYVWHDSFIYVSWLIHIRDMTHVIRLTSRFQTAVSVTHMNESCHTYVNEACHKYNHSSRQQSVISVTDLWHDSSMCMTFQRAVSHVRCAMLTVVQTSHSWLVSFVIHLLHHQ